MRRSDRARSRVLMTVGQAMPVPCQCGGVFGCTGLAGGRVRARLVSRAGLSDLAQALQASRSPDVFMCLVPDTASGRGDPDRRSPTQHAPLRRGRGPLRIPIAPGTETTVSSRQWFRKLVWFGFRPEAWHSLLAPTRHLYVFRIPVRTSIIPRTAPGRHHPQGYKTLTFAPTHLHPKGTGCGRPPRSGVSPTPKPTRIPPANRTQQPASSSPPA
jgi:hypothetical protein